MVNWQELYSFAEICALCKDDEGFKEKYGNNAVSLLSIPLSGFFVLIFFFSEFGIANGNAAQVCQILFAD